MARGNTRSTRDNTNDTPRGKRLERKHTQLLSTSKQVCVTGIQRKKKKAIGKQSPVVPSSSTRKTSLNTSNTKTPSSGSKLMPSPLNIQNEATTQSIRRSSGENSNGTNIVTEMDKGTTDRASSDKIRGSDRMNTHCNRGSNSVDGRSIIANMVVDGNDGRFDWRADSDESGK